MCETEKFLIIYEGNVSEFEEQLLSNSEQEIRIGKIGDWCKLADIYARQLTIICINPYPEESDESEIEDDETTPSIKHINKSIEYDNFYRWGIQGRGTGNHRIVFAIHNYHKVILLHHFDKKYNGSIKRNDLVPAELYYEQYSVLDPSRY